MGKLIARNSPDDLRKVQTPSKRSAKDPNAPKRARSAYIYYTTAVTKKIREANPGWSQPDIMREAASRWKELADKTKYEEQAALDRERYDNEVASYVPAPESSALGKKAKKTKDPNAPKKPKTAYLVFSMAEGKRVRQEFPQLPQTEVMKKISESWRQLDGEDKRPFEVEAAADKERYQRELAAYEEEP